MKISICDLEQQRSADDGADSCAPSALIRARACGEDCPVLHRLRVTRDGHLHDRYLALSELQRELPSRVLKKAEDGDLGAVKSQDVVVDDGHSYEVWGPKSRPLLFQHPARVVSLN